ncbi:MAG: hypothetical protein HOB72_17995 [Rhodospirillaceae bacterium]|nr:hypothetical protein [Rhodospirillaceae bacterium]
MKYRTAVIAFALLILGTMFAGAASAKKTHQGAVDFERSGVKYRLIWQAEKVRTGRYGKDSTKVSYTVYAGADILYPRTLDSGTFIGCRDTPPERVDWWRIGKPQIGWLLNLSSICAMSRSHKSLIVVPYKTEHGFSSKYVTADFVTKEWPVLKVVENGDVHVWSSYQNWNGGTTAGSFYVPEFRVISRTMDGKYWVRCPRLPQDVSQWPHELPHRGFIGDFYAGLNRLNAKVMKSVLETYKEIVPRRLRKHGLPDSRQGLERLVKGVATVDRRLESLKSELSDLHLDWNNLITVTVYLTNFSPWLLGTSPNRSTI